MATRGYKCSRQVGVASRGRDECETRAVRSGWAEPMHTQPISRGRARGSTAAGTLHNKTAAPGGPAAAHLRTARCRRSPHLCAQGAEGLEARLTTATPHSAPPHGPAHQPASQQQSHLPSSLTVHGPLAAQAGGTVVQRQRRLAAHQHSGRIMEALLVPAVLPVLLHTWTGRQAGGRGGWEDGSAPAAQARLPAGQPACACTCAASPAGRCASHRPLHAPAPHSR